MREFNFAPRAPAAQLPRAPTRQPWKPNREIRLAIVSWRLSISQTCHPAHCQTLELGHTSWTTYFTVRCSNIYKCTSVCHPSHNRWDFYPAVIPASKLSPPVLISWLSEGGYINMFLWKENLDTTRVTSHIVPAQLLNQKTAFSHSGLGAGIINAPRGPSGSAQNLHGGDAHVMEMKEFLRV